MKGLTAYDKLLSTFLMISFFLSSQWQVFFLIPICAFFAIRDVLAVKEQRLWKNSLVLLSLYSLYVLWLAFTPQRYLPVLLKQLEYRASLAVLPLAFLCIGQQTKQTIRAQMKWFVWSCIGRLFFYFMLILSITFFTENVLSTQTGVVFFAFFISLFFLGQQKQSITYRSDPD